MTLDASRASFEEARRVIPGGVNSPVRAFRAVGGTPVFIASGEGAFLTDIDGNRYLDFVGSWGPLILGHAAPDVVAAVREAAGRGLSYGAPHPGETELARLVLRAFPGHEKVRLVSSGTEAAMTALRLARGATGRSRIVKFEGCYHGHVDSLLVGAGSGALTLGIPTSAGIPEGCLRETVVLPFNDPEAVGRTFRDLGGEIAALIVEPAPANMGLVPPAPGFLEHLRKVTREAGSLLIFDEVITGFRVRPGGMQELTGILPDLTVLGKVLGGGMPVGAVAGPARLLDHLAPEGRVYQAGTLSGNPVAVAAGIATLRRVLEAGFYATLESLGRRLEDRLRRAVERTGTPATIHRLGSLLTLFFTPGPVRDLKDASASDTTRFGRFHAAMLRRGIYLPPSQFEAWFVSAAHAAEDVDRAARAAEEALRESAA